MTWWCKTGAFGADNVGHSGGRASSSSRKAVCERVGQQASQRAIQRQPYAHIHTHTHTSRVQLSRASARPSAYYLYNNNNMKQRPKKERERATESLLIERERWRDRLERTAAAGRSARPRHTMRRPRKCVTYNSRRCVAFFPSRAQRWPIPYEMHCSDHTMCVCVYIYIPTCCMCAYTFMYRVGLSVFKILIPDIRYLFITCVLTAAGGILPVIDVTIL